MGHVTVPMEQWWHLEHSIQLANSFLPRERLKNLRAELTHPDAQYYVALCHGGLGEWASYLMLKKM
jgi:hypothetical protein